MYIEVLPHHTIEANRQISSISCLFWGQLPIRQLDKDSILQTEALHHQLWLKPIQDSFILKRCFLRCLEQRWWYPTAVVLHFFSLHLPYRLRFKCVAQRWSLPTAILLQSFSVHLPWRLRFKCLQQRWSLPTAIWLQSFSVHLPWCLRFKCLKQRRSSPTAITSQSVTVHIPWRWSPRCLEQRQCFPIAITLHFFLCIYHIACDSSALQKRW